MLMSDNGAQTADCVSRLRPIAPRTPVAEHPEVEGTAAVGVWGTGARRGFGLRLYKCPHYRHSGLGFLQAGFLTLHVVVRS